MKVINHNFENVEIDIDEIVNNIDMVFHEKLTKKTCMTMDHYKIYRFVINEIKYHNTRQTKIKTKIDKSIKKVKKIEKLVDSYKTVCDLDSISNKFKFYVLGYVLHNAETIDDKK